ncbi:MAG: RHS repeat-associated core domain-containing protein [Thermoanaerobaculia bacterium]
MIADPRGTNGSDVSLVTTVEYEHRTNQPVRVVDPRGIVTEIDRNVLGLPESVTRAVEEPEASTGFYDYNDFGQVVKLTNPNGHVTTFEYFATGPSRGYLERQTIDPEELALTTRYETDARGNVTAVIDPRGVRHESEWNALDWLRGETRATTASSDSAPPLYYTTLYRYDGNGNLAQLERPFGDEGLESTFERYEYGILDELLVTRRQIEVGQEEGWVVETREYDPNLNLTLLTEPDGQKTQYVYEERDLLQSVTYGLGTPEEVTESYIYEPERQQESYTDGRGHAWQTDYDGYARVKTGRDPLGNRTTTTYDNNGNPIEQRSLDATDDRLLAQMSYAYDNLDRRIASTEKLWRYDAEELGLPSEGVRDLVTKTEYDPASNVVKATDALGRETTFEYDTAERSVQVTDPIGNRTQRVLDPASNVIELHTFELIPESLGGGEVEVVERMTHDAVNRIVTHADALDNTTTYRYDARDNLRFTVDPLNYETQQVYDGLDRRITSIRPSGIRVNYLYDRSSRLRAYYDALENATNYQYDALNRRTSTTWPDDTVEILTYDGSHNVRERTDPNGTVITQLFDEAKRLTGRTILPGGGAIGPESESYTYDGLYRTTLARSGEIETRLSYDSLSRLLSDTTVDRTLTYDYDDTDNVVGIGYPSGLQVRQDFDDLNRPLAIGEQAGEDFNEAVSYGYRGPYLQATTNFANGIQVLKGFDPIRRRLSETARGLFGFSVFEENLTWSPRSLKTSESRGDLNGRDRLFGYDGASRVTQTAVVPVAADFVQNNQPTDPFLLARLPEGESLNYDEADNMTSRIERRGDAGEVHTMPLDGSGRNRPGWIDGEVLSYDDNGNMTSKGSRTFSYDFRNRLTRVSEPGQEIATYTYDAFNRRVSKLVDGETEETVWGGWRPLEEYRDGKLTSRRTYGSGLDEIVRTERDVNGDGTIDSAYAPLYDETGNLALLTLAQIALSAAKPSGAPSLAPGAEPGQPVERYSYSTYGERRIFVDSLGPVVEQVRTSAGELLLELSEEVLFEALEAALAEGRITLTETASGQILEITLAQPVTTGRQAGRRLLVTPTAIPAPGTELNLTLPADALRDSFGNTASVAFELTFTWPSGEKVHFDDTLPRLEQVFLRDGQLEIVFSEEPDTTNAGAALQVDGQSIEWTLDEDRYMLRTAGALELGSHKLAASTTPLDLAGLGLTEPFELFFEVHEVPEECPPDTICATTSAPALLYEAPDLREISTSAAGNDFGFHGLPHDPETGLVYMRNRYYDPELGRFISTDPMGYVDGPSLYGFAGNTPYNSTDALGLQKAKRSDRESSMRAWREADETRRRRCEIEGPTSLACLGSLQFVAYSMWGDKPGYGAAPRHLQVVGSAGGQEALFINGIWNHRVRAENNASEAAAWFRRRVLPLWNPTTGAFADLAQTAMVNWSRVPDETLRLVVQTVREHLKSLPKDENLTVFAHSQGAAIASGSLSFLSSDELSRIDLVTIGGAVCTYPQGLGSLTAYVNTRDPVPMYLGAGVPMCARAIESHSNYEIMYYSFGHPYSMSSSQSLKAYREAAMRYPASRGPITSELSKVREDIGRGTRRLEQWLHYVESPEFWWVAAGM